MWHRLDVACKQARISGLARDTSVGAKRESNIDPPVLISFFFFRVLGFPAYPLVFQPVDQASSMQQQHTPLQFTLTDEITSFYDYSITFRFINSKVGVWWLSKPFSFLVGPNAY